MDAVRQTLNWADAKRDACRASYCTQAWTVPSWRRLVCWKVRHRTVRSHAGRGVGTKVSSPPSCSAITLPAGLKVAPSIP